MPRPKKIKDQIRISFVVSKAQGNEIQKRAIQMTKQTGRIVTISETLRELVAVAFPVPKAQLDLFGKELK